MRLINIEDVSLLKSVSCGGMSAKALWKLIKGQPTIDAVEVVRCRDCKYAKLFEDRDGLCGHPSNNAWDIWDEFYCGRGVKHE